MTICGGKFLEYQSILQTVVHVILGSDVPRSEYITQQYEEQQHVCEHHEPHLPRLIAFAAVANVAEDHVHR